MSGLKPLSCKYISHIKPRTLAAGVYGTGYCATRIIAGTQMDFFWIPVLLAPYLIATFLLLRDGLGQLVSDVRMDCSARLHAFGDGGLDEFFNG